MTYIQVIMHPRILSNCTLKLGVVVYFLINLKWLSGNNYIRKNYDPQFGSIVLGLWPFYGQRLFLPFLFHGDWQPEQSMTTLSQTRRGVTFWLLLLCYRSSSHLFTWYLPCLLYYLCSDFRGCWVHIYVYRWTL